MPSLERNELCKRFRQTWPNCSYNGYVRRVFSITHLCSQFAADQHVLQFSSSIKMASKQKGGGSFQNQESHVSLPRVTCSRNGQYKSKKSTTVHCFHVLLYSPSMVSILPLKLKNRRELASCKGLGLSAVSNELRWIFSTAMACS